jgi:outer membrane usher protein
VRRSRGATLTIVLPDGTPMPAGALVEIEGGERAFPVAEGGATYLTGLAPDNRIVVRRGGDACGFTLAYPDTRDPLPDLGRFVCTPRGTP